MTLKILSRGTPHCVMLLDNDFFLYAWLCLRCFVIEEITMDLANLDCGEQSCDI